LLSHVRLRRGPNLDRSDSVPEEGASWLLCSGCVAVFGGFWIAFAWLFAMPMTIALIFAFDTLFQGIAIAGFGISLKEDR